MTPPAAQATLIPALAPVERPLDEEEEPESKEGEEEEDPLERLAFPAPNPDPDVDRGVQWRAQVPSQLFLD